MVLGAGGFGDTFKVALMLEFLDRGVMRGLRDVENRVNSLRRTADRVASPFTNLQNALNSLGAVSQKMAFVGGAITGALAYPTYQAMQFEDAIAKVATMLDSDFVTTKRKFYQHIIDLSNMLGQSADNIASAMYQALSAGIPEENVIQFLEEAGKAAVAGATDLFTAVDGLTSALNAYGLTAEDVTEVSDLFFTAVKEGKTTFEELAQGIGKVAPIAASAGVDLEELLGATAELTKSGLSTSEAFTSIRAIIEAIINPTEEAKRVFEELGIEIDANTLKEKGLKGTLEEIIDAIDAYAISEGERYDLLGKVIGRVEGLNGALVLTGKGHEDFIRILERMNNAQGATSEAYEKMAESAAFNFRRITQSLKNLALEIGDFLLPVLEDLIERVRKIIEPIRDWIRNHEELAGKLMRFVGILGMVLLAAGSLGWVLSIVGKGLLAVWTLTGPWGLALLGVAAAIGLIVAYREEIADFFKRVKKGIEDNVPVLRDYIKHFDEAKSKWQEILEEKGVPEPVAGVFANFFAQQEAKIKTVQTLYEKVRNYIQTHSLADLWGEIQKQLEKLGRTIAQTPLGEQIQKLLDKVFIPVVEKIRDFFLQLREYGNAFVAGLLYPFRRLSDFLGGIPERVLEAINNLFAATEEAFRSGAERILEALRSIARRIVGALDFTDAVTGVQAQFESMATSAQDVLQLGLERAKELVMTAWARIQEIFNLDAALAVLKEQLDEVLRIINDTLLLAREGAKKAWAQIEQVINIDNIKEALLSGANAIQQVLGDLLTIYKEYVYSVFEAIKNIWAQIKETLTLSDIRETLTGEIVAIREVFIGALEEIVEYVRTTLDSIRNAIQPVTDILKQLAQGIEDAFSKVVDTLRGLLAPLENFKEKLLNTWDAIQKALPWNWFKGGEQPPAQEIPAPPQPEQERGGIFKWFSSLDDKILDWLNLRNNEAATATPGVSVNMNVNVDAEVNNERDIRDFARRMAEITADEVERAIRRNYGVVR